MFNLKTTTMQKLQTRAAQRELAQTKKEYALMAVALAVMGFALVMFALFGNL